MYKSPGEVTKGYPRVNNRLTDRSFPLQSIQYRDNLLSMLSGTVFNFHFCKIFNQQRSAKKANGVDVFHLCIMHRVF